MHVGVPQNKGTGAIFAVKMYCEVLWWDSQGHADNVKIWHTELMDIYT